MKCFAPHALIALSLLAATSGCDKKSETTPTQTSPPASTSSATPHEPDNTAANKVDRSGATKTPMDQAQSSASVEITAAIRRAIVEDSTLSMNAKNCKVILDTAGVVTLRGVVDSQAEKDAIESKAKSAQGVVRVDNQLEVKSQ